MAHGSAATRSEDSQCSVALCRFIVAINSTLAVLADAVNATSTYSGNPTAG
jgi:hypothetical protein